MDTIRIGNESVSLECVPAFGGKIISLWDHASGCEMFFPNPRETYAERAFGDDFSTKDASGFDDAFPNVDASEMQWNERTVTFPDHGELWTTPMEAKQAGDTVTLSCETRSLHCAYEKTIRPEGRGVRLFYRITNLESETIPCLWTMHGLMNCEAGDRIVLPKGNEKAVNLFPGPVLGDPRELCVTDEPALTVVPEAGENVMFKYYLIEPVREGYCAVERLRKGVRCALSWDPGKLPYFGLWCTMGGYRGDHNIAPEPTTGYYDRVDRALNNGRIRMLAPNESFEFDIRLAFSDL